MALPREAVMDLNAIAIFILKDIGGVIVVGGIARVLFQPFIENYLLNAHKRKEVEIRDWLCKQVFSDRIKRVDQGVEMAHVNKDVLTGIREMIDAHGHQIADHNKVLSQVDRLADSVDRVSKAMENLEGFVSETRDIAIDIRGRFEQGSKTWDGPERRKPIT